MPESRPEAPNAESATPAQKPFGAGWREYWRLFVPKSVTVLFNEGYSFAAFRADFVAGLTVAIVALPLAMAIAIASGATPAQGLITVVVAGFLISALGGSRFQIGGPTGAFIVVIYAVVHRYGYDGLLAATLMAGLMLIAAGLLRLGNWIKYVPEPVVTGFTAGIAVIIFTSQIRDLAGLQMKSVPADFIPKIMAFWAARASANWPSLGLSAGAIATIFLLRRFAPKWPGFLIVVLSGALIVFALDLPVDTIGSRFGVAQSVLPSLHWPNFSAGRLRELLPSAATIAFLAGIESLLSAMVADSMTGRRHRSNVELLAQGVANIGSALFGGISATGAIARTATNIRAGGRTPIAGMLHAVFVFASLIGLGRLIAFIPLPSLAAVLVVVAWNMSERDRFLHLLKGDKGDRAVLLTTFLMTVLADLTLAIGAGIVVAAILFMHRMAETTALEHGAPLFEPDQDDLAGPPRPAYDSAEATANRHGRVEVLTLRGPLFFGVAMRLADAFDSFFPAPAAFILHMKETPLADMSGVQALDHFLKRCAEAKTPVFIAEAPRQTKASLENAGIFNRPGVRFCPTLEAARAAAGPNHA